MDLFNSHQAAETTTVALLPGIVKTLFSLEENPLRFEMVCIDLLKEELQIPFVPTSKTWDRGRDARSISPGGPAIPAVVCATLSQSLESKVQADIKRLLETTKTTEIYYCTSRELTEDACDKLEAAIRSMYSSDVTVKVLAKCSSLTLGRNILTYFGSITGLR
jgi:hypothetical protein